MNQDRSLQRDMRLTVASCWLPSLTTFASRLTHSSHISLTTYSSLNHTLSVVFLKANASNNDINTPGPRSCSADSILQFRPWIPSIISDSGQYVVYWRKHAQYHVDLQSAQHHTSCCITKDNVFRHVTASLWLAACKVTENPWWLYKRSTRSRTATTQATSNPN